MGGAGRRMRPHRRRGRVEHGAGRPPLPGHALMSRYCGKRITLPADDYVVKEKYLRRFRKLGEILSDEAGEIIGEFDGVVNVGPDSDEIWVEKGLSEAEKRFVVVHELVHARRQLSGEDFEDYDLEERIVELEACARADRKLLGEMPNGLTLILLHDFLTDRSMITPKTKEGLIRIYDRIRLLLGGIKTAACET